MPIGASASEFPYCTSISSMILCFLERPTVEEVKKCWSENLQQELTAHQSVWNCRHPRRLGWLELITLVSNDNLPMSSSTTTLRTTTEVEGFTSFRSILRTTDSKSLWCFGKLSFDDSFLNFKIHINSIVTTLRAYILEKHMRESRVLVPYTHYSHGTYETTYHTIIRRTYKNIFSI